MSERTNKIVEEAFQKEVSSEITNEEAITAISQCPIVMLREIMLKTYIFGLVMGQSPYESFKKVAAAYAATIEDLGSILE